ncbi:MAG: hypothetical protein M0P31_00405 [Solirubrobacteraceae bacterium]|nr:hypothetical protein [Solirubrobacteraceae bacterium]
MPLPRPTSVLRPGLFARRRADRPRWPDALTVGRPTGRDRRADRRTHALAAFAFATGVAAVTVEVMRVWRRGSAPVPSDDEYTVIGAGTQAVGETVQVAVAGFRSGTDRENTALALLLSFTTTWILTRLSTHTIRRRGTFGPVRNVVLGDTHVHHFVPGIVLAFTSGAAAIVVRSGGLDRWLAIPFGAGVALTLDESALLLKLDDVYWTEEGVVSVQVTLASIAILASLSLVGRTLRRGEEEVLDADAAPLTGTVALKVTRHGAGPTG